MARGLHLYPGKAAALLVMTCKEQEMNQRYQQDPYRARPGSRPDDYARNVQGRGERFGRPYDDDSPRSRYEMGQYEEGYDEPQYLGSYPSDQGARYYEPRGYEPNRPLGGQYAGQGMQRAPMPRGQQGVPYRGTAQPDYGYEDFRQQRNLQRQYATGPAPNPYPRQAQ